MTTIAESNTAFAKEKIVDADWARIGDGILTRIDDVEKKTVMASTNFYVTVEDHDAEWKYSRANVAAWVEDCFLVELAEERGYTIDTLQELQGELVYLRRKTDEDIWSMESEHPRDLFDENEIEAALGEVPEWATETETLAESEPFEQPDSVSVEAECMGFERKGEYFVCEIERIVEVVRPEQANGIRVCVATPYDDGIWEFKKPYSWDDENVLVQLAESLGYTESNFTDMVGERVLVKRNDAGDEWVLNTTRVDDYRQNREASESSTTETQSSDGMVSDIVRKLMLSSIMSLITLLIFILIFDMVV